MYKKYLILATISVGLGILLSLSIWMMMYYLFLLVVGAAVFVAIIVVDLFGKTSNWIGALRALVFGIIALLVAMTIDLIIEEFDQNKRENVLTNIYNYREEFGKFPADIKYLNVSSKKYRYTPDSLFKNFTLSAKDRRGFRWYFNNKDSSWLR